MRMVLDHQGEYSSRWAAVSSIAAKIGCTAQTLNEWVKKAEVDNTSRPAFQAKWPGSGTGELRASASQ
jgi:transposase